MERPYIICHMVMSIDGKVTGDFLDSEEGINAAEDYYEIHREFKADAFACGRITMEGSFTGGWYPNLTEFQGKMIEREDYIADYDADFYAVAFDTHGKLGWKDAVIHDEDPGYNNAHIVEVLSEDVEDAYLGYLRQTGISYIFAGKHEIDIELAVHKLWQHCISRRLLLEGGAALNGSFVRAGVIDELSLIQAPVFAAKEDKLLFGEAEGGHYQMMSAEELEHSFWLRYHSGHAASIPRLKLSVIIDAIEMASDEWQYFYDLKTNESIFLSDYNEFDDEEWETLEEEPDRFIRLPDKYEIHEYSIMSDFVNSRKKEKERNQLERAIQGRGAFRRFKDSVNQMGIADQWYEFQENAYRDIAIRWCEDNGYEYEE